jgi:hypothetical protein
MPPLSPPVNTAARRHRSGFSAVWRLNVLYCRANAVLSYLFKPLTDLARRAFREK